MSGFIIDADISKAKTISTLFYTDRGYYEEAKEKIFSSSWQLVGDAAMLKEKGSCFPVQLLPGYLDEPILLTRDKNEQLHCLSNVCTHRGNLLVDDHCKLANIRCRYHGRMFELNGRMISMPEFKEVKSFPSAEDHLHELPLFNWQKFLFVSLGT
jgi:choline monooxygenase